MNTRRFTKGFLFGASLLLASAAFAGEKATIKVYEDVKVNGKTLTPGVYQLAWEGTGSNVQLNIRQGGNDVATVPAAVEASKSAASGTGYTTKQEGDGTKSVTTVFFAGKKVVLNLDQRAANAAAQQATPGNR
jgi:hypothetical protein